MKKRTNKVHFKRKKKQTQDREVEIKEDSSMSVYNFMQLESDSTRNCNVITLLQFRRPPRILTAHYIRSSRKENDRERTARARTRARIVRMGR